MSAQSSGTVFFRAVVMLACIFVLPAIALFGSSWPEALRQLMQRHLGVNFSLASITAPLLNNGQSLLPAAHATPQPVEPAPPVVSMPPMVAPAVAPLQASLLPTGGTGSAPGWPIPPRKSDVVPAGFQTVTDPGLSTVAVGTTPPAPAAMTSLSPPASAPGLLSAADAGSAGNDRFANIQKRLRELGATYFLLESWGSDGQLYRFYCKMAIGGNANLTRYFEATDADSLTAMSKVLQQVEVWRSGRL